MTSISLRAPARRWLLPALAVAAVAVAVALALFQPWKLWVDEVVDEALPTGAVAAAVSVAPAADTTASAASPAPAATTAPPPTTSATAAPETPSTVAPPVGAAPIVAAPVEPAPDAPATPVETAPEAPAAAPGDTTAPALAAPASNVPTPEPAPPAEPAPTTFASKAHATSGTVRLLTLEDGTRVLRLEDLDTDNGPDLKVVLSTDPDGYTGEGAVSLGTLKGNKGSQNYEIPAGVDLSSLRSVVIWCKRFDVDFGVAALPGA